MQFIRLFSVRVLLVITVTTVVSLPASWADDESLPTVHIVDTRNLQDDGELSQKTQKPILILFSMAGCAYCEYIEEEHLKPMLRNQEYRSKVIIRRVMTDDYDNLIDFNGNKISALDFSARYGSFLTPTVVFLNHEGVELTQRLLGVRNTEYYGGDLDESLERSLRKLRQQLAANQLK